jgi:acetyl-CoA carboxylase biotin carboxyl carrier protein
VALDDDDVREILRLVDSSDLEELRIETPGLSLHVRRGGAPVTPSPDPPRVEQRTAPDEIAPPVTPVTPDTLVAVASPMLGTFYRAEAPGSRPFVEVGDRVEVGSIVCLIEVMKLMNHVVSEVAGTVAEICVEDGALVEFEQTLVRVAPGP